MEVEVAGRELTGRLCLCEQSRVDGGGGAVGGNIA